MPLENLVSAINSIVAMIVSLIALVYTVKTYLLKSGANIRGSYLTCSDRACEDSYINSLTLENLKDRAIVVFKIYLKLGNNYFIQLDDFENDPLIIKPFEVFKKVYDPIDFYSVNTRRISIEELLNNRKVKKYIVLSTSDGKYTVKSRIVNWNPMFDFFNNFFTFVIYPRRLVYNDKAYGSNTKYIIELKTERDRKEIIPIHPRDYEIKIFKDFRITEESLKSKESLEEFLYEKAVEGMLNCTDITVHDFESWREEAYGRDNKEIVKAKYMNWFYYHAIGRIYTLISNYRLKRRNRALQKKKPDK